MLGGNAYTFQKLSRFIILALNFCLC